MEIVQKLKSNLNLQCCYLDSVFSSVLVIVRLLLLCICLKINIISLPFCLYMSVPLLISPVPKTGNRTSPTVLASQSKKKDCNLFLLEVFIKCSTIFSFFFFSLPSIFFNSICMTPYLVYKLLPPKPLL